MPVDKRSGDSSGSYKTDTAESDASPHPHDRADAFTTPTRVPTPSLGVPGVPPAVDELTPSPQFSLSEALAQVEADRRAQKSNFVWPIALPLPAARRNVRKAQPPPDAPTIPMNGASTWLLAIGAVAFLLTAALIFHGTLHARPTPTETPQPLTRIAHPATPAPVAAEPVVLPAENEPDQAAKSESKSPEQPGAEKAAAEKAGAERASAAPKATWTASSRSAEPTRRRGDRAERVPWWE